MADTKEETPQVIEDCSNSDVVTKYKLAAEITNCALKAVLEQAVAGKDVMEVCKFADTIMSKRCSMVFKTKKIDKGIAFPTCLSVNETICHYSPLPSESRQLKAGDWVKVDLGCHIDGYIAVGAHTFIVGEAVEADAEPAEPKVLTGAQADVLLAAHSAVQVCQRLIKPGNTNIEVTKALDEIATAYGVKAMHGTIMHQMKRFVIDANKTIAQRQDADNKVAKIEFEENEVYAIDICFTTGLDKPVESEQRTTVFKRCVDKTYRLKMKSSRYVFSEINQKCPTLPFSIRAFDDERQARMGVVECVKHGLLQSYPILQGREGDAIAHLKVTFLMLPSGGCAITGVDMPLDRLQSDKTLSEELKALMSTSLKKKKNKAPAADKGCGECCK